MSKELTVKGLLIDEVIIEHRDKNGKLIRRHKLNSGFKHWLLKKLGLAHNCMCLAGIQDVAQWISGLSAPTAYGFMGIGSGTTGDTIDDATLQAAILIRAVTPTVETTTKTLDTVRWVHVFSKANDASLTGFASDVNEVAITSAAASYHMLLRIAGSVNYGAVDHCTWDNGDLLSITINCKQEQGA